MMLPIQSVRRTRRQRPATVLLMIVGLLAMLFIILSAYITLARFDRQTLQQVQNGRETQELLGSILDVMRAQVRQAWLDPTGKVLASGRARKADLSDENGDGKVFDLGDVLSSYAAEDVPALPGTLWMQSVEPRRTESLRDSPAGYDYPVAASTEGPAFGRPIARFFIDYAGDGAEFGVGYNFDPDDPDYANYARVPVGDADADGIPDNDLGQMRLYTQVANATHGIVTRMPDATFRYWNLKAEKQSGNPQYDVWQRFNEQARYEVGVRILPHGALLGLDSPASVAGSRYDGEANPWNRNFVNQMFNWLAHPDDIDTRRDRLGSGNLLDEDRLFALLRGETSATEAILRRRGGRLTPVAPDEAPAGMKLWTTRFPRTFGATNPWESGSLKLKSEPWQRFNLATISQNQFGEWTAFRWASSVDAAGFNSEYQNAFDQWLRQARSRDEFKMHAFRAALTAQSNSDELARVQVPIQPGQYDFDDNGKRYRRKYYQNGDRWTEEMGINVGQLKFYLGQIASLFDKDARLKLDPKNGEDVAFTIMVETLAGYYYDMLAGHAWEVGDEDVGDDPEQVLALRDQAMMLAVNTIAFAAPRDPNGFIDLVSAYIPTGGPEEQDYQQTRFIGYAPQPFITQVIAYQQGELSMDPDMFLLVELYNPNDRMEDSNGVDHHALNLNQFAITVEPLQGGDGFVRGVARLGPYFIAAGQSDRLRGRTFTGVVIAEEGSGIPLPEQDPPFVRVDYKDEEIPRKEQAGTIRIKLWRTGMLDAYGRPLQKRNGPGELGDDMWVLVDQFELDTDEMGQDSDLVDPQGLYGDYFRDTETESYWGRDARGSPPRWRVALAAPANQIKSVGGFGRPVDRLKEFRAAGPRNSDLDSRGAPRRFAPTVPLYTMNAGAEPRAYIHGSYRPASFPTVGFLHFVPRFSHYERFNTRAVDEGDPRRRSVKSAMGAGHWYYVFDGSTRSPGLFAEWQRREYSYEKSDPRWAPPADFGHMRIFENKQEAQEGNVPRPSSYFLDDRVGRIPWGLLVYDYFTVLNPNDPNGDGLTDDRLDPLRVPGRININVAPWFVMAGLPVIGPVNSQTGKVDESGILPLMNRDRPLYEWPSPAFWDPGSKVLVGSLSLDDADYHEIYNKENQAQLDFWRLKARNKPESGDGRGLLFQDTEANWWRLGPFLAQSAAAYRDRAPYASMSTGGQNPYAYQEAELRNGVLLTDGNGDGDFSDSEDVPLEPVFPPYRSARMYGPIRGAAASGGENGARERGRLGFLSVGELANVKGFDSTEYDPRTGRPMHGDGLTTVLDGYWSSDEDDLTRASHRSPDFFKAVSLLALIDSNFLVTRSNTFTAYVTVTDRKNPDSSIHAQMTLDRSNLLPKLVTGEFLSATLDAPITGTSVPVLTKAYPIKGKGGGSVKGAVTVENPSLPEIVSQRQSGYRNARYDD